MKPHLRLYCDMWRCSGQRERVYVAEMEAWYYPFPWGYGHTWQGAYEAWKKLQKRPAKPKESHDSPGN